MFRVAMDVVTHDGISEFAVEIDAPSAMDAESEGHLIATYGEGLTVLQITDVQELAHS